jgi:hypothetical protein
VRVAFLQHSVFDGFGTLILHLGNLLSRLHRGGAVSAAAVPFSLLPAVSA